MLDVGFHIHDGGEQPVPAHDSTGRKRLAEYLLRHPSSLQKITWNATTKIHLPLRGILLQKPDAAGPKKRNPPGAWEAVRAGRGWKSVRSRSGWFIAPAPAPPRA